MAASTSVPVGRTRRLKNRPARRRTWRRPRPPARRIDRRGSRARRRRTVGRAAASCASSAALIGHRQAIRRAEPPARGRRGGPARRLKRVIREDTSMTPACVTETIRRRRPVRLRASVVTSGARFGALRAAPPSRMPISAASCAARHGRGRGQVAQLRRPGGLRPRAARGLGPRPPLSDRSGRRGVRRRGLRDSAARLEHGRQRGVRARRRSRRAAVAARACTSASSS